MTVKNVQVRRAVLLLLVVVARAGSQSKPAEYATAIDSARRLIADGMVASQIPGLSVAIAVKGNIVWSEAFGVATVEPATKATTSTLFRVGSVSKSLTAAALMRLRESGRIDLDGTVQRYVPDFPAQHPPITVRQLASHLSGIRHYRGDEFLSRERFASVTAALAPFKNDSLLFAPGTRFSYSTFGYVLLSAVMERAAGMSFLAFVDSTVIRPLGLKKTVPDFADSVVAGRAMFYFRNPHGWEATPAVDQSNKWAGGGYLSTAEDMVRLGVASLRPGFLSAASHALMFESATLPNGERTGYGIGWFVGADSSGHRVAYHGGSSVGGTAMLSLHPQEEVVLCLLVNTAASRMVDQLSDRVVHLFVRR